MKEMSRIRAFQHDRLHRIPMGRTWLSPDLQKAKQFFESSMEASDYA